ncbi:GTP cyclohydrolase II [Coccidioides posadasii str. Silveira]|uniref:GTP cyclohydrolase II n=1 Tax=Coccidioides posadasii (strain RMSCC 757 / Silveira) TaxID=443226 RepID=E9DAM4_COCPS|nr:GTP cyclohydrolase II [Coccidioides posadasii str. Silveira]QVM11054.1 GTP cyclohydrolase II [Coccidioides posadasii str. Silveira]
MPDFPSHSSSYLAPQPIHPKRQFTEFALPTDSPTSAPTSGPRDAPRSVKDDEISRSSSHNAADESDASTAPLPASIISPAQTPPLTPGSLLPSLLSPQPGTKDRPPFTKPPKLLPRLPNVECIVRARIPTTSGSEMFLHLYQNDVDNKEHLAIVFGNTIRSRSLDRVREGETEMDRMIRGAYVGRLRPGRISSRYDDDDSAEKPSSASPKIKDPGEENESLPEESASGEVKAPLVRIHSECYTGETAWSARCDCGEQLDEAARLMSTDPTGGVIIYLRQEGRGIGLGEKLKAYNLQDLGSDTVEANLLLRHPADARSYGLATAMLVDLGLGIDSENVGIRLLTNNPDKIRAVEGPNREVIVKERVPMVPLAWSTNGEKGIRSTEVEGYLRTKIGKMGHLLS